MNTRTYLFVPGDRKEMLAKAESRGADAVIVDLEDAVAPASKASARRTTAEWLRQRDRPIVPGWVRINPGVDGELDLEALSDEIAGVMIPKVERAEEVTRWSERLEGVKPSCPLIILVETAAAVRDIDSIASHPTVVQLMIGEADLGADIGMKPGHPAWYTLRTSVVVASAAAGLHPPIGPVDPDASSSDRLEAETRDLKDMGFGSRAIIHPAQIEPVHRALNPSPEEVDEARRVVNRHEQALAAGEGAYRSDDGHLVDEAFVKRARRVLALARVET